MAWQFTQASTQSLIKPLTPTCYLNMAVWYLQAYSFALLIVHVLTAGTAFLEDLFLNQI